MASRQQIAELINDCWAYFKTTNPPPKTVDSWAEELTYLDIFNSGDFIRHKFKHADAFPANFPKVIKGIYHDWLRQQPKQATGEAGCQMCLAGVIHATKGGYCFAFRCGHCRSADVQYPDATRDDLAGRGYALDWQHDYQGVVDRPALTQFRQEFGQEDEIPF